MRRTRLLFVFLAFYFVFLGGSAYYTLVFPIRSFHHAFVTLLFGVWFFRKWRGDGLPRTPLNLPIFALVIVWFFTSFTSPDPRMSFEYLWFMLLHVAIFYALADLLQRGRHRLLMETQFILGALVVIITGIELASWYFGLGIIPGTEIGWLEVIGPGAWLPLEPPRAALAMNISTLLAGYVAPLVTVVLAWALTARREDYRTALKYLAFALLVVLLLTLSRGGLLSLLAALGTWSLMRLAQQPQLKHTILQRLRLRGGRRLLLGTALIVALLAGALLFVSQFRYSGDQVRVDLYRSATEIFMDHPITGVGTGIFGRAYREYRAADISTRDRLASAHNLYLNIAAETGLAGLIVSGWFGLVLLRTWWANWQGQSHPARRLRLEACIAALVGVGVHSMVDVFTTTPVLSVCLLLLAYSVIGQRGWHDERPAGLRWPALLGLLITLGYGVFFFQSDRAQFHYQQSLAGGTGALEAAQTAAALDPALNLYTLHIAHLLGEQATRNPTEQNLSRAEAAYRQALDLEPTWSVGWINLAGLLEQQGRPQEAIEHLKLAQRINPLDPTWVHLARLQEETGTGTEEEIRYNYRAGLHWNLTLNNRLPISDFWTQTPLRRQAIEDYLEITADPEIAYRIRSALAPGWADEPTLMPEPANPPTAADYWIQAQMAEAAFDEQAAAENYRRAAAIAPRNGDYYAAWASALTVADADSEESLADPARRLGKIAQLLGTRFENPGLGRVVTQEFAAVLYGGRAATLDVLLWMRPPGPGEATLARWYGVAEQHRTQGRRGDACRVYYMIYNAAFDHQDAMQQLMNLGCL